MEEFSKILASWSVKEYEQYDRTIVWYIGSSLIAVALLFFAIWTVNYLFVLVIFLAGLVIYLQHKNEPQKVEFLITAKGIKIGSQFYPYKEIQKFWILYEPPGIKKLYFSFKNILSHYLMVPLKNQNPLKIREILLGFLEEDLEKEEEPSSEQFAKLIKL